MLLTSAGELMHRRSPNVIPLQSEDTRHRREETPDFSYAMSCHLSATMVGSGIVALPVTLKRLGVIPGILMIVAGAVLAEQSIDIILRYWRASRNASYAGVVSDYFGATIARLLLAFIVLHNLGVLVVYVVAIGDVLAGTWSDGVHHSGIAEELFGQQWWTTRSYLLMLTTLFVLAPLVSFKRLDPLMYASALSIDLAFLFIVVIAGATLLKLAERNIAMPRMMPEVVDRASVQKLFTAVPVIMIAYCCHHNVHPLDNDLRNPTQIRSIVRSSLGLSLIIYVATSFSSILLFGEHVLDDVLANFDGDLGIPFSKLVDNVVRVSYCIHAILEFPVIFFSLRLNLDSLLNPSAAPIARNNPRFYAITIALLGLIFLVADLEPNIWDTFRIIGSTASVTIGFILPSAIAIRDAHGIATKKDKVASWLMIVLSALTVLSNAGALAVFSNAAAISSNIYRYITARNQVPT